MRAIRNIAIVLVVLVALLVALLMFAAHVRYDTLAQKTSLSDQVVATLPPLPVAADGEPASDDANESADSGLAADDPPKVAGATPLGLKRAATREEALAEFSRGEKELAKLAGSFGVETKPRRSRLNFWFYKTIEPLVAVVSDVEGREVLFHAGIEATQLGDLDTAHTYLRAAHEGYVNATGRLHYWHNERIADTAMHLAWLEDDPEVAGCLLEKALAVESKFGAHRVAEAAQLAAVTGSEELHEHYLSQDKLAQSLRRSTQPQKGGSK